MATSGYFETNIAPIEGSSSTYPKSVRTDWTATYDSASMQWTVTWSSKAQGNASYPGKWTTVQNGTTSFTSSQTLDPASPSATMSSPKDAKHNQELLSGSFKISINTSGDASFTGNMNFHVNSTGSSGLCTATQTFNLDNIPLASTITPGVTSLSITSSSVSALSFTIRSRANYYHELKYGISESSATTKLSAQRINNTTYSGTITIAEILAKFPATTSGTLYLYLKTFKESAKTNQVGTTQVASVAISITANGTGIIPTITLGNIAVNSSPISGYLVAGFSSAKATVSGASPSGSSVSRIAYSYKFGSSSTTTGNISAASGTITTSNAPSSTSNVTLTITATVYDARGGSVSASKTATVYAYSTPVITANIYRTAASSGSSPARDEAGEYVYVSFSATQSYTVNNQNSIQSTVCTASGGATGTKTSGTFVALSTTKTATFTIVSTDKVSSKTVAVVIPTATYALELYDDKNGTLWAKSGGPFYAMNNLSVSRPSSHPLIFFQSPSDTTYGYIQGMTATTNGVTRSRHFDLGMYSYNSTTGARIDKYEDFAFPDVDADLTANKGYKVLTTKNPDDIPAASASQSGAVSTGNQTFGGRKTVALINPDVYDGTGNTSRYRYIRFKNNAGNSVASIRGDSGNTTNITLSRIQFLEYSPNATADTGTTGYVEIYSLPSCAKGLSADATYTILTTKSTVTVEQGGTGATDASAARANLKIQTVALDNGASVGTTEVQISGLASDYQAFIVTGVPGTTATVSAFIPKAALTSTASTWQINTEGNYLMFTMRVDGENVYAQVTGPSGTSKKLKFYGVRGA